MDSQHCPSVVAIFIGQFHRSLQPIEVNGSVPLLATGPLSSANCELTDKYYITTKKNLTLPNNGGPPPPPPPLILILLSLLSIWWMLARTKRSNMETSCVGTGRWGKISFNLSAVDEQVNWHTNSKFSLFGPLRHG